MSTIIKKFNPESLKNLTEEEVKELCSLSQAELKVLAEEYPNYKSKSSYLLAIIVGSGQQEVPTLSSFQNVVDFNKSSQTRKLNIIGVHGGKALAEFSFTEPKQVSAVKEVTHDAVMPAALDLTPASTDPKIYKHIISAEDIEMNPELAEQGVKVGDEVEISDEVFTDEEIKKLIEGLKLKSTSTDDTKGDENTALSTPAIATKPNEKVKEEKPAAKPKQ